MNLGVVFRIRLQATTEHRIQSSRRTERLGSLITDITNGGQGNLGALSLYPKASELSRGFREFQYYATGST